MCIDMYVDLLMVDAVSGIDEQKAIDRYGIDVLSRAILCGYVTIDSTGTVILAEHRHESND